MVGWLKAALSNTIVIKNYGKYNRFAVLITTVEYFIAQSRETKKSSGDCVEVERRVVSLALVPRWKSDVGCPHIRDQPAYLRLRN